jgi:hypothetical protein
MPANVTRRRPEPQEWPQPQPDLDTALERRIDDLLQTFLQARDWPSRRSLWKGMLRLRSQRRPEFVAALEAERLRRCGISSRPMSRTVGHIW